MASPLSITDPTPRNYNAIWGEDIIHFAVAMGIPSFYYTGVSHGSFAGWHIAFHRPELLKVFACVDGHELAERLRELL